MGMKDLAKRESRNIEGKMEDGSGGEREVVLSGGSQPAS
jgi:hypothetical protein